MRTPADNPVDPLGGLGAPVRPPAPAPASSAPAPHFELGNWGATLPEGLAEKPADPAPASILSADELKGIANIDISDWLGW